MYVTGNILTILLLAVMSLQDFRSRSISAWLLPAITFALLVASVGANEWQLLFSNFIVNVLLLSLQFVALWLVISIRRKSWTNIINTYIGTGDILLLVCLTPFFSILNYSILFVASILIALFGAVIQRSFSRNANEYIPFAGILSIPLIALCVLRLVWPNVVVFSSDEWINIFLS